MFGNNKNTERIQNLEEMVVQLITTVNSQAELIEELQLNSNPGRVVFKGFGHKSE